jgi:hypothetical protein
MTHLKNPGPNPEVRKSEDGIVVYVRPADISHPIEEWTRIFNDLAAGTAYEAGTEDKDLVLRVSFATNDDQATTDAKLDALVDLISATDSHFEEVRSAELAMRSQVEDWWTRYMAKSIQN